MRSPARSWGQATSSVALRMPEVERWWQLDRQGRMTYCETDHLRAGFGVVESNAEKPLNCSYQLGRVVAALGRAFRLYSRAIGARRRSRLSR